MKKAVLCSVLSGAALLASTASATLVEDWEFEAGLELFAHHYRESHFMRIDGTQFGLYGSGRVSDPFSRLLNIESLACPPLLAELSLSYVGGDVTYDGARGGQPLKGDVGNSIFQFRPLFGYVFDDLEIAGLEPITLMPYSGLCYRYLSNDLTDLGEGGYTRKQNYLYLPLGVRASLPLPMEDRLQLGFRMELDILIYGWHHAGSPLDADFTQDSGWGFQFAPSARYELSESISLTAELFFRYWKIAKSDTDEGYLEPENGTSEFGLKTGVVF